MEAYPHSSALANSIKKKKKTFVNSSLIVLAAFFSAFFSRLLDTFGAPSAINFAHFATVPFAFVITLTRTKIKNRNQKESVYIILFLLLLFLSVILTSAMLNSAGMINAILVFLLWAEPFLLLVSILCLPTSQKILKRLQKWVTYSFFFHTLLAFVQHYIFQLHHLSGAQDNIQGVFYRSGAGHVVGASVALTFAIYYVVTASKNPLWLRWLFLLAAFWHMLLADAKQVLLSLLVGATLLLMTKFKNTLEAVKYIVVGAVICGALLWCIQNLEAFRAFNTWMRPEIYGSDGEATLLKSAAFRIIPTFYESSLNWFFGLGPGHSVDRMGGWMLDDYWHLLGPLGATIHPASKGVWRAVGESWLGNQSSMFSPLFGWASLWGDLGFIGLCTYVYMGVTVYKRICVSDLSKFMLFSVFAVGFVFSQMQEPGYMLSVSMLIGLDWHRCQSKNN